MLKIVLIVIAVIVVLGVFGQKIIAWLENAVSRLEKFEDSMDEAVAKRKVEAARKPAEPVYEAPPPAFDTSPLVTQMSTDSEGVVDALIEQLAKGPPERTVTYFIEHNFTGSKCTRLASALLNNDAASQPGALSSIVDLALAIDDSDIVVDRARELGAALDGPRRFSLYANWKVDGLTFDKAVDEFHAAGLMSVPDEESIQEVKDDWGLEDLNRDHEADTFERLLLEQSWVMNFEACKPGKYVSYTELVDFVFANADEFGRASDVKAHLDDQNLVVQVSWSVADQDFSYPSENSMVGEVDVEWVVAVMNDALSKLSSPKRCVIGHSMDDHVVLLVADTNILIPLMEKYSLRPELLTWPLSQV